MNNKAASRPRFEPPLLGDTALLGAFYRAMFDTGDWGEAAAERPPHRPGPVARSEGSLAKRRLADPEARFYYMLMMAEVSLFPLCVAHDGDERDRYNEEIAAILGLDEAAERGWITGFVICWRPGHFPRSPTHVRVLSPKGRTARAKALGELEPHLRSFLRSAKGEDR